jgi:hypothetical protein
LFGGYHLSKPDKLVSEEGGKRSTLKYGDIKFKPQFWEPYIVQVVRDHGLPQYVDSVEFMHLEDYLAGPGRHTTQDELLTMVTTAGTVLLNTDSVFGGKRSKIYIFEHAFNSGALQSDDEFLSLLYDHEGMHAKNYAEGLYYSNGRKITKNDFAFEREGEFYWQTTAMMAVDELVAYRNMLNNIKNCSDQTKEKMERRYIQYFGEFIQTGTVLDRAFYLETLQEFLKPWVMESGIISFTTYNGSKRMYVATDSGKNIMLPAALKDPRDR